MSKNIKYTTENISRFYRNHRTRWMEFYESERTILERVAPGPTTSVLDVGSACGGLGLALRERFGVVDYCGIDINEEAIETGRALFPDAKLIAGDILDVEPNQLPHEKFDLVVSFSCVDWNIEFLPMLSKLYSLVADGGHLVSSFRLTDQKSILDPHRSFQYIDFDGKRTGETAPYAVIRLDELLETLRRFQPAAITAYGYFGPPSATAVLPYGRICFSVFDVRKGSNFENPRLSLDLPAEILATLHQ